jgi:hypothetical protein
MTITTCCHYINATALRRVEEMQRQVMEQLGEIKLSKGGGRRTSSISNTTTTSTPRETQLEVCTVLYACSHYDSVRKLAFRVFAF